MASVGLDDIDRKILNMLQDNAQLSNAELSKAVGLNNSSVFERVRKLEQKGIIKSYVALVDSDKVGKPLRAFIRLTVRTDAHRGFSDTYQRIRDACLAEPDILECHSVAGEDSLILKVCVGGPKQLEELIAKARTITGSPHSVTSIVLSTFKETTSIPPGE